MFNWGKKEEKKELVNPATSPHPGDRQKNKPQPLNVEKKPVKPVAPIKRQTPEEAIKSRLTPAELQKHVQLGVPLFELINLYKETEQVPKPDNLANDARVLTESCRDMGYEIEKISPRELIGIFIDLFKHNRDLAALNKPPSTLPLIKVKRDAEAAVRRELGLPPNKPPTNEKEYRERWQAKIDAMTVIAKRNRAEKLGLTLGQLLTQESQQPGANLDNLKKLYALSRKMEAEEIARRQLAKPTP